MVIIQRHACGMEAELPSAPCGRCGGFGAWETVQVERETRISVESPDQGSEQHEGNGSASGSTQEFVGAAWKCSVCRRPNDPADDTCLACGFAAPNAECGIVVSVAVPGVAAPLSLREGEALLLGHWSASEAVGAAMSAFPNVSRRHAVLECDADGVVVTDVGSTNGTYVVQSEVEAPIRINAPMRVGVGREVVLQLGNSNARANARVHVVVDDGSGRA